MAAEEALSTDLHSTRGEKWVVAMETPNMPYAEEHETCIAGTFIVGCFLSTQPYTIWNT